MKKLSTVPCDHCGTETSAPELCPHGWELCCGCAAVECCQACSYESAAVRWEETRSERWT